MRRLFGILALSLALPLVACGGDSTAPEETIHGTYTLQSINGMPLPWLLGQASADRIDVMSGSIILLENGTFTDLTTFRITESGVVRMEDDVYTGTFLKTAIGATLNPVGFEPYGVSIDGETMIQQLGSATLTYRR
jgi:hypothetical protein